MIKFCALIIVFLVFNSKTNASYLEFPSAIAEDSALQGPVDLSGLEAFADLGEDEVAAAQQALQDWDAASGVRITQSFQTNGLTCKAKMSEVCQQYSIKCEGLPNEILCKSDPTFDAKICETAGQALPELVNTKCLSVKQLTYKEDQSEETLRNLIKKIFGLP